MTDKSVAAYLNLIHMYLQRYITWHHIVLQDMIITNTGSIAIRFVTDVTFLFKHLMTFQIYHAILVVEIFNLGTTGLTDLL